MVTNKQDAKQKHADLYAFRQRYVSNWQRIAQYVDPEKKFNINGAVYQSTGTDLGYLDQTLERALRVNAAGQHELITPKSQEWFSFEPLAKIDDQSQIDSTIENIYYETGRQVAWFMRNSNFHTASELFYFNRAAYGQAAFWSEWDKVRGMLKFAHIPVGDFMVDRDKFGNVHTFCWDEWLRIQDIVATFPENVLPDMVKEKYQASSVNPDNYLVFHLLEKVERTGDEKLIKEANGRPWVMRSVFDQSGDVLATQYFWTSPVSVSNYFDIANSPYGVGAGLRALGDQTELTNSVKALSESAMQKIFPPMLVPEGFDGNIDWGFGGVTTFNPMNVQAKPTPLFQNMMQANEMQWQVQRLEKNIQKTCDMDLFAPLLQVKDPQYMKATVAQMIEAYSARIASPAYTRLTEEFLQPVVMRCYELLRDEGLVPALDDFSIKFTTPFQMLLDRHQPTLFSEFMQTIAIPLAQIDPDVMISFDTDFIMRSGIKSIGMPTKILKDKAKVDRLIKEREAAQQGANQMANALEASEIQKNIGSAIGNMR